MRRDFRNLLFSAFDLSLIKLGLFFSTVRSWFSLWVQGCAPGKGLRTSGMCYYKARRTGSIILGERITFLASDRTNRVGLTGAVIYCIPWMRE